MNTSEIEKRIAVLEDIEAIKKLKARYCDICDDDHDPEKIVTVFAEDGIWEGGDFGQAQGHRAIRKLFEGLQRLFSFSEHYATNPTIEVNGDHATGTWDLLCPYTFREKNGVRWIAGSYEDDYVKINGEWKFKHLRAIVRKTERYETERANKQ